MNADVKTPGFNFIKYEQYLTKEWTSEADELKGFAFMQKVLSNMSHNLRAFLSRVHTYLFKTNEGDRKWINNEKIFNHITKKLVLQANQLTFNNEQQVSSKWVIDPNEVIDDKLQTFLNPKFAMETIAATVAELQTVFKSMDKSAISPRKVESLQFIFDDVENRINELQKPKNLVEVEETKTIASEDKHENIDAIPQNPTDDEIIRQDLTGVEQEVLKDSQLDKVIEQEASQDVEPKLIEDEEKELEDNSSLVQQNNEEANVNAQGLLPNEDELITPFTDENADAATQNPDADETLLNQNENVIDHEAEKDDHLDTVVKEEVPSDAELKALTDEEKELVAPVISHWQKIGKSRKELREGITQLKQAIAADVKSIVNDFLTPEPSTNFITRYINAYLQYDDGELNNNSELNDNSKLNDIVNKLTVNNETLTTEELEYSFAEFKILALESESLTVQNRLNTIDEYFKTINKFEEKLA